MIKKIVSQVKQLEPDEQEELLRHIERQYARKEKKGMLRDDIKSGVIELVESLFCHRRFIVQENYTWVELNMDAVDIITLAEAIQQRFEIEKNPKMQIDKWETVADVINYIETQLEETQAPASSMW